jgi:hypothetical protein
MEQDVVKDDAPVSQPLFSTSEQTLQNDCLEESTGQATPDCTYAVEEHVDIIADNGSLQLHDRILLPKTYLLIRKLAQFLQFFTDINKDHQRHGEHIPCKSIHPA